MSEQLAQSIASAMSPATILLIIAIVIVGGCIAIGLLSGKSLSSILGLPGSTKKTRRRQEYYEATKTNPDRELATMKRDYDETVLQLIREAITPVNDKPSEAAVSSTEHHVDNSDDWSNWDDWD